MTLRFEGDTWMFAYSRKTKGQNSASFFYLLSLDKFITFILLLGQSVTCKLGFGASAGLVLGCVKSPIKARTWDHTTLVPPLGQPCIPTSPDHRCSINPIHNMRSTRDFHRATWLSGKPSLSSGSINGTHKECTLKSTGHVIHISLYL